MTPRSGESGVFSRKPSMVGRSLLRWPSSSGLCVRSPSTGVISWVSPPSTGSPLRPVSEVTRKEERRRQKERGGSQKEEKENLCFFFFYTPDRPHPSRVRPRQGGVKWERRCTRRHPGPLPHDKHVPGTSVGETLSDNDEDYLVN